MKLLTPKNVAESLNVSRSTVLRMISDGSLPAVCLRSGKRKKVWRVRPEILERWLISKEREEQKRARGANTAAQPVGAGFNGQDAEARDSESCAR